MSEVPSPPVERVLRHLEVAQVPSVKELPQFPLFLHNAKDLRKLIAHNNEVKKKDAPIEKRWDSYMRGKWGEIIASPNFDGNIADAEKQHMDKMELEKESFFEAQEKSYLRNTEGAFLLHDVNTNITLFAGLEMFKGAENKPTPSWYPEYKRLQKEITTFSSHPEYSIKDKLERYNALARHIRRHANEIELPDGQSEYAKDYLANAVNMAHLWPMLHASGNTVDAIYKQNFDQIDKWYKALATMRIPIERLARAFGNDIFRNETISFPQGDVDGLQGMTLFNIIQEIKRTRLQKCVIEKNGSQFSLHVKAGEVPQRDRLFKPSEVVNGKTLPGDGIYTVHQFHSVLSGANIHYSDNADHVAKPPYSYTFRLDDANSTERVQPPLDELRINPGFHSFQTNHAIAEQFKSQARNIDWYNFTFHDVLSPLGKYSVYTMGSKEVPNPIADALHHFNNETDLDKKVLLLEKLVSLELPEAKDWPPEYIAKINKKINILKKLFPIFKPSLQFLLHPNSETYKNLRDVHVDVHDIMSAFSFTDEQRSQIPQKQLNGFEGIIFFNLLKNAEAHSPIKSEMVDGQLSNEPDMRNVTVSVSESDITVTNYSDDPHPGEDVLFQYKGKGKSGHTGYGMFTAAKLYAPLLGSQIEAEWTEREADEDKSKYKVRFTLKKTPSYNIL